MRYFKTSAGATRRLLRGGRHGAARWILPLLVAMLALAAAPSHARTASASGGQLKIHATDFSFMSDVSTVAPGSVHVEFFNDSKDYNHEVIIFSADQQAKLDEFLAARHAGQDVEESDFLTIAGAVEDVAPGTSVAFDVNLTEGEYVLACFISSPIAGEDTLHYDMGMHSTLTVSTSSAPAPTTVPSQANVAVPPVTASERLQAPNTGSGPSNSDPNLAWVVAFGAVAVLMLGSGALLRKASRR